MAERRPAIGVTLGAVGREAGWWLDSASRLDEAGYDSVWCSDHFISRGDRRTPVLEAWTMLSAAAARTQRIRLGPFVLNVMNRHPAVVARMAATFQELSGGRLVLGIGIGGHRAEHVALGLAFPPPGERLVHLKEAVAVLRALWTGGPVERPSKLYPLHGAVGFPRPDPPPPIIIGAQTARGARVAARIGDGWTAPIETFERDLPAYLEALAVAGRARADQEVIVSYEAGRSDRDAIVGTAWAAAPLDELARWQALGADAVVVSARTPADVDALLVAAERW